MSALTKAGQSSRGLRLLAQDALAGHGNIGEGMSVSRDRRGRRIMWLAHESAPIEFTAVDVTDPRQPQVVAQQRLPHNDMRSNSLDVVGDIMVVAYQSKQAGARPAGMAIYDVSEPERPRQIGFFDASGPESRGVHQLWFVDGKYVHMSAGAADFEPAHPLEDQFYRIVDVSEPSRPVEVGRWWLPGTRRGEEEAHPLHRPAGKRSHYRVHNTNVYPARPDRAYLGYLDGGAVVLDIGDLSRPQPISRWDNSPPFQGFTHTVLPLFERQLLVVTDESIVDAAADWPKLVWLVDARDERNLVPISTVPLPKPREFAAFGGRYGAHNIHENQPVEFSFRSETLVFGSFFSGGLRVFDISDEYRPSEVAHFIPECPVGAPYGAAQLNDVFVDDRGVVFAVDRQVGGLYALEMTL